MSEPENTDPNTVAADAGATPPAVDSPPAVVTGPSPESPEGAPAEARDASASAEAPAEGGDADGGDAEGGDEGGADEGGAEAGAGEAGGAEGAPKKKRRRRRKKKGPGAGDAAAAGDGAEASPTGEGAEGTQQTAPKPKKEKKEKKEPRERPAFNVGDVVFGKVLEVTDDVLFIDVAGKARAVFDLRELLIVDEPDAPRVEEPEDDDAEGATDAADRGEVAAESAEGAPPAIAEGETPPATLASGATPPAPDALEPAEAEGTPAEAEAAPAEAEAAPAQPEGVTAAGDAASVLAQASKEAAKPPPENPQLPRVILEPGATFVGLVHNDGGRGGLVVLTHHPKRASRAKVHVSQASKDGTLVDGLVTGVIKGGIEVDVDGLRAFAPASHVDLRPGSDLSPLVGKRLKFLVTQYGKRGRDVVLSRRAQLEAEAKATREEALKTLQIGGVVDGTVRTVVQFGAFVDVGGVEGLVPLSEMSHNRADQPKDVFKVGETVRVKILRVDEKGKIWLSRKAAIEDPWSRVAEKFAPLSKHTGKVARLQPFGAFIELEPGVDGLIHTADLSIKRIEHPEELLKVGQELEVVVASVDAKAHRIALHPAPTGEAANEAPQRVQLHKNLRVVIMAVEQAGLTVRVLGATGRQARGFISASATGTPRGTELRKHFPVGKELEAKVVEHDPRRGDLKLSIRALNDETERNAYQQYRAQVKREAKFGTFADLLAKRNEKG